MTSPVLKLPAMLNVPPKLVPMITGFNDYDYLLLEGGRSCVHGDTPIATPEGDIAIKDFEGGDVYSMGFAGERITTYAGKPYRSGGKHDLYKVTLSTGESFVCTDEHRLFSSSLQWSSLSDLDIGQSLLTASSLPQSSSDTSLQGSLVNVQHYLGRVLSSLYRYYSDYHLCGEQLLVEVDTFLDALPLLTDAPARNHYDSETDGKASSDIYNHLLSLIHHLAISGKLYQSEVQDCKERENRICATSSELLSVSYQLSLLSRQNKDLDVSIPEVAQALLGLYERLSSLQSENLSKVLDIFSCNIHDTRDVLYDGLSLASSLGVISDLPTITKIESFGKDYYYDLSVPLYNNYIAAGVVHHNSSKSSSAARFILYLCDTTPDLRVVGGREVMERISESVHTLFGDIIKNYNLDFTIYKDCIRHNSNGSEIRYKGFKSAEESASKGLEGVDILWIDEAQDISEDTLETIIPTIRKQNSKIFFSMNRFMRNDPVYVRYANNPQCLHINVNYYDNPHLTPREVEKAEESKRRSEAEYNRVWLGIPYDRASDYLFNTTTLTGAVKTLPSVGYEFPAKVIGIDFAAQGDDRCVACIIEREGNMQWGITDMVSWASKDPSDSIGRIVQLLGREKPDVAILDVGGMGTIVHARLVELGVKIERFDGASTKGVTKDYYNARAMGYWLTKIMLDDGNLRLPLNNNDLIQELEAIKMKHRSDGKRLIVDKLEIKKTLKRSPDCFIAGTMVMTPSGEKPIESFKEGDLVTTAWGTAKVTHLHKTRTKKLTTATFSNGQELTGKGKHTIFTWKGWIPLDRLSSSDKIESWNKISRIKWTILNVFFTKGKDIGFKHQVDIIAEAAGGVRARDFYTGLSGWKTLGKFLKGIMSTIKTMIGAITTLVTLLLCLPRNIYLFLRKQVNGLVAKRTSGSCEKRESFLKNGMLQKREGSGIQKTQRKRGSVRSCMKALANNVRKLTKTYFPTRTNYCSNPCWQRARYHKQKPIVQNCEMCGTSFETSKRRPAKCCTRKCSAAMRERNIRLQSDS